MTLSVHTHGRPGEWTLAVRGDIDLATAAELEEAITGVLDDTSPDTVILVDLGHVPLLDSSGINALLKSRRRADQAGRVFRVVGATGVVAEVLRLTGTAEHLGGNLA